MKGICPELLQLQIKCHFSDGYILTLRKKEKGGERVLSTYSCLFASLTICYNSKVAAVL